MAKGVDFLLSALAQGPRPARELIETAAATGIPYAAVFPWSRARGFELARNALVRASVDRKRTNARALLTIVCQRINRVCARGRVDKDFMLARALHALRGPHGYTYLRCDRDGLRDPAATSERASCEIKYCLSHAYPPFPLMTFSVRVTGLTLIRQEV